MKLLLGIPAGQSICLSFAEQIYILDAFRYCGQNIGIVTGNYTFEPTEIINLYFDFWFDEYKDCNMTYIDDYQLLETKLQFYDSMNR